MTRNFFGIVLALLGGVLVGNCMLPLKRIRVWPWECTWLVFSLVSLLIVPCLVASLTVPEWPGLYSSLTTVELMPSLLFGFGWGIAQVLFGISVVRLGMALAFTIVVGLGTVFGTLVPLVFLHRSELASGDSRTLMAGCGLMIFGVVLCGYAGKLREQSQRETDQGYLSGLVIAVLSGVLSSMLNLSLAFGAPIAQAAMHRGAPTSTAVFAVWPVALASGLIPNLAYAAWLLYKNQSWNFLKQSSQDAFLSLLMGLLWIGAVLIYGLSTRYLGRLGDSAGWAIYQIVMVVTANAAGIVAGEWKAASRRSHIFVASGVLILVLATVTTAVSTR
jgi:L-rhamnose-H+ transport protein